MLQVGPGGVKAFGRRAADVLVRLVNGEHVRRCAVAWGRTVQAVVAAVPVQHLGQDKEFFPLCGEPLNYRTRGLSPTDAAVTMADAYRIDRANVKSLQGVPARVPRDLENRDVIKEFAWRSRAYHDIFGPKDDLDTSRLATADIVLTGLGSADSSIGDPMFQETTECEPGVDLAKLSSGNIAGIWLPKPESSEKDRQLLDEINGRWLGVTLDHLNAVARRAYLDRRQGGAPGVVVVALDASKKEIVRAALPLVNHLIISTELAEALLDPAFR